MKVLFDECVPRQLRRHLKPHQCTTVGEMGWSGIKNGQLLELAERSAFEALFTVDKGLPKQQNLEGRRIAVVLLRSRSNRRKDLISRMASVVAALEQLQPGQLVIVE